MNLLKALICYVHSYSVLINFKTYHILVHTYNHKLLLWEKRCGNTLLNVTFAASIKLTTSVAINDFSLIITLLDPLEEACSQNFLL